MKTYIVSLNVINSVEFLSERDLKEEICREVFTEESSRYQSVVRVFLPYYTETKERIRRNISNTTDNNRLIRENYYCVPKKETIRLEIDADPNDVDIKANLCRFVCDVNRGLLRIGNNTTLGKGLCSINSEEFSEQNKISPVFFPVDQGSELQKLVVRAKTDTGILIRNRGGKPHNYAVDANGNPIVPASSWKGIFRNTIKNWLLYYGEDMSVLNQMFGNRDKGIKGCLIFYDSIIENPIVIKEKRSHIDKFTGATMTGGIKEQQYVLGNFNLVIECTENIAVLKKYLIRVLSDFQDRRINVGADFGIGKGIIQIDDVQWTAPTTEVVPRIKDKSISEVSFSAKDIDEIKGAISAYRATCANIATRLQGTENHLMSLNGGFNGLAAAGFDDFYMRIFPSVTTTLYDGDSSLMGSIERMLDEIRRAFLDELDPALERSNKNIITGDNRV